MLSEMHRLQAIRLLQTAYEFAVSTENTEIQKCLKGVHAVLAVPQDLESVMLDAPQRASSAMHKRYERDVVNHHVLLNDSDFTDEEEESQDTLFNLVVYGGLGVCGHCSASEMALDTSCTSPKSRVWRCLACSSLAGKCVCKKPAIDLKRKP